jgi:hypothetical protein
MGTSSPALLDLNWDALNISLAALSHLDLPFAMTELKAAIDDMYAEKAPGPDGFIGVFSKNVGRSLGMICLPP